MKEQGRGPVGVSRDVGGGGNRVLTWQPTWKLGNKKLTCLNWTQCERSAIQFTLQKEVNGKTNSFTLCFHVGESEAEDTLDEDMKIISNSFNSNLEGHTGQLGQSEGPKTCRILNKQLRRCCDSASCSSCLVVFFLFLFAYCVCFDFFQLRSVGRRQCRKNLDRKHDDKT